MEFIRSEKIRPDYDPNTRHCLYGLDADLVSGFEHVLIFSVGKVTCTVCLCVLILQKSGLCH